MNVRSIHSVLAVTIALVAACTIAAAGAKRSETKPGDFELTVTADKAEYRVGETPNFSAVLKNKSGGEVLLVPALDGSDRMRYPRVRFDIKRPEDAPPPESFGRCGNSNNIQPEDFVKVAAGGALDPAASWVKPGKHLFNAPGTYTVSLTYDTSAENKAWYGFMGELKRQKEIDRLLAQVPNIKLTSEAIEITFTGDAAAPKPDPAEKK